MASPRDPATALPLASLIAPTSGQALTSGLVTLLPGTAESLAICLDHICEWMVTYGHISTTDIIRQIASAHTNGYAYGTANDNKDQILYDFAALLLMHKDYCKGVSVDMVEAVLIEAGSERGDAMRFVRHLCANSYNRQLVQTFERQLYAFAPLYTKPGDMICILHGCEQPMVLRPKGTKYGEFGGEFFQLIGTVYMDGIMEVSTTLWQVYNMLTGDRASILISYGTKTHLGRRHDGSI